MDTPNIQARLQRRLLKRAQRRLTRLMDLMAMFQSNPQGSDQDPGEMEDSITNNFTGLFTRGLALGSLGSPRPITTTPGPLMMEPTTTTTTTTEVAVSDNHEELCHDIRGRDRVCCNTAVTCFDDLTTTLDDLSNAANDFSLMSACRVVGSELKKDKRCVSSALSRCTGPGRSLMHSRLDNRLDALYDQFYKHCRRNPFPPPRPTTTHTIPQTSTTQGSDVDIHPTATQPAIVVTTRAGNTGTSGSSGSSHTTNQRPPMTASDTPAEYGAIIAGALTGGVILLVILLIAAVLWCRSRRENLGSDSSAGIIFYKPRHAPRPMPDNNNKPPLLRQESDHYAEIDERLVNPNMRPSLPPQLTNVGYLNPVGDGESVNYFQPEAYNGAPLATTRGQLSYGAILASNKAQPTGGATYYHSSPVVHRAPTANDIHNSETLLSPRRFMSQHQVESYPNSYVTSDSYTDTDQDDYEQPISASSSLRYSELNKNDSPDQVAPSPPARNIKGPGNVVQSQTGASAPNITDLDQPVPSPRTRTKKELPVDTNKSNAAESIKIQLGSRDSSMSEASTKSSHHYFVLEPGSDKVDLPYENSVSSPKLV